jgi:hypothetical protein
VKNLLNQLARSPVFTTVSVLTLALGIGANTAIFSVVNGVLLKPLPFEDSEELVGVWHMAPGIADGQFPQSPALHYTYQDYNQVFAGLGMFDDQTVAVTGLDEPERVSAMRVTFSTFPVLRVPPFIGRGFTAEDDSPGTALTAMLSHGYWQRKLGGDPDVIGQTLRIDGRAREIIGVMPPDFRFLTFDPAVYLPFQFDLLRQLQLYSRCQAQTRRDPRAGERRRGSDGPPHLREVCPAPRVQSGDARDERVRR